VALSALSLTAASSLVNGTSYTTASVSLKVNKLYVVCIVTQGVNPTDRQVATLSGAGQTWQLLDSSLFSAFSAAAVYVTRPTAINSGALTITTTLNQDTCSWAVFEIDDLAAGLAGSTAADAIGAISKVTAANTTTITATPSFTALRNGTFAINFWDRDAGGGTAVATAGSGFSTAAQANAIDGGNAYGTAVHGQFRVQNDTSADVIWSAAGVGLASFAFEVKAAVDPAAVRSLLSAYPWTGVPWGSWGWLGSPATGGPTIEARQFASSGASSASFTAVSIQARSLVSSGVGSFNPTSAQIQSRQFSVAGIGAFNPVAGSIEARQFTSAGTGLATFVTANVQSRTLTSGGVGFFNPASAQIEARQLISSGAGAALFSVASVEARQFASSGASSFSPTASVIEARSFASSASANVAFDGVNATGGASIQARSFAISGTSSANFAAIGFQPVQARSFAGAGASSTNFASGAIQARSLTSAGVSTAAFAASVIEARGFASAGVGTAAFTAANIEARSFTSAGSGAAVWQNGTAVVESRSFNSAGTSSAAFVNGTSQPDNAIDGDGGSARRGTIMRKLLVAYEDEPARKSASKKLKKISDEERAALKKLAKRIESEGVDSYESVAQKVTDALDAIGYEPKEIHLDWFMYYARVLAYQIAQESFSEEEEILMVMMV
jgi:hypothetical protein